MVAGWGLAIVGTEGILGAIRLFTPLRVSEEQEVSGLDRALHGELADNVGAGVGTERI